MNTPKLDALLKDVDAANAVSVERDPADSAWEYDRKVLAVLDPLACAAPRLAAMLRVAVEAARGLTEYGDGSRRDPTYTQYGGCCPRGVCFYCGASDSHRAELTHDETCPWVAASAALARIEQIAAESRSDDPGTAEEGAV